MGRRYSSSEDDSEDDRRRSRGRHDDNRRSRPDEGKRSRRRSPSVSSYELEEPPRRGGGGGGGGGGKSAAAKVPTRVSRSCTDLLFLVLFIFVLLAWALLAFTTFKNVDPRKLLVGKDSHGRSCGVDADVAHQKYLYISNFAECIGIKSQNKIIPSFDCANVTKMCVSECPSENWVLDPNNITEEAIAKSVCDIGARNDLDGLTEKKDKFNTFVDNKNCTDNTARSHLLLFFCVPYPEKNSTSGADLLDPAQRVGLILNIISDISLSYPYILGGFGLSLVLAFVWMLFMRFFAGVIVWTSLLAFVFVFGGLAGYTGYQTYDLHKTNPDAQIDSGRLNDVAYMKGRWPLWAGFTALFGLLFVVFFLIFVFLRKRVHIAVALIKQASRSIGSQPSLVAFPVLPYVLKGAGLVIMVAISLLVSTLANAAANDPDAMKRTCSADFGGSQEAGKFCMGLVEALSFSTYVHIFNVFCGVWAIMFVSALGYFVVAHSVAEYFWTRKTEDSKCLAVLGSLGVATRFHLGSLAFGSLIVTVLGLIKMALKWLHDKTKRSPNSACIKGILKCCICCFWFLEKFMKYVSHNAYILVAMYGKNFCRSASRAFNLIVSNALRALVLTRVTGFIIFVAQLVTVVGTAAAAYFAMTIPKSHDFLKVPSLYSVFVPVGVIAVGSFVLTSCFFNVYSNAVDTLFICFLEDKKINDGSRERPYQMPSELLRILNKRNYKPRKN